MMYVKGSDLAMRKKYENKYILLTGSKEIKVSKLMNIIGKYLNINKMEFRNEKVTGHYVKTPFSYKPKKYFLLI